MKEVSKDEMKKVMGGVEDPPPGCAYPKCNSSDDCHSGESCYATPDTGLCSGKCGKSGTAGPGGPQ